MNYSDKICDNKAFLPSRWREKFADAQIKRQTIGESHADVFRIHRNASNDLFVKSEPVGLKSQLPNEIERIRWLNQVNIPGPKIIDTTTENNRHWLLMIAIAGQDLASTTDLAPSQTISIMATALQTLHQVPTTKCPFNHNLKQRVDTAIERASAGLVDEAHFDEQRLGRSTKDITVELLATIPSKQDLVVTHGDACLPNFMADAGRFTGFIDCGRLGISDRFQDLALSARSIARNLGSEWVAPFFTAYGIEPDEERMNFYCLLDEFF